MARARAELGSLIATVNDPQNRLAALAQQHFPAILGLYRGVTLLCSQATSPEAAALLRDLGATVTCDEDEPDGHFYIGRKRRQLLRLGLAIGADYLHLCDFDRALHWAATYPDELGQTVAAVPGYDFLVLGRTLRAFETHPPYQTQTEMPANYIFGLVYGQEMDIAAGSRALSRRAAECLVAHSQELGVGVDAEWPLLLRRVGDMKIGYRACEGLEFETADRFGSEIEAAGGPAAWVEAMNSSPQRWVYRLRLATEIAEAAARFVEEGR
jgi:hypothetical protein